MPVPDEYHIAEPGHQPTNVLLLPSFTVVENVTPQLAPELLQQFVNRSVTTTTPLGTCPTTTQSLSETQSNEAKPEQASPTTTIPSTPLQSHPCPHSAIILLCSQRTRDARCGQSAPLLRREFERHLRTLGLYRDMDDRRRGGVGIYFISHVGGHKYAANVMVYRRRDFDWHKHSKNSIADVHSAAAPDEGAAQGIWLARVRPQDCENIVRYTVLEGKVVKPSVQLRGGFDRERGVISW